MPFRMPSGHIKRAKLVQVDTNRMSYLKYLSVFGALVCCVLAQGDGLTRIYPDYNNHPCLRECNGQVRTCTYDFTVDKYFTMKPDCMNCANGNYSQCFNPQCIPGDGRRRIVSVVNSMLPGPAIEVCQGDTVIVFLENLMDPETVTIHWHGIHQRNTQYMDGVPGITQCPIQPFTRFRYRFVATEVGTHFWHSHSASQRADGFYGHLIVKKPKSSEFHRNLYDQDVHRMSFLEWLPEPSPVNLYRYLRTFEFYDTRVSTILVNGFGPMTNTTVPAPRFNVQRGIRYRFRVINAANAVCPVTMSIDNHKMIMINSDGYDLQAMEVDSFTISNGERYDFVLNANQAVNEYRIRITGTMFCSVNSMAVLHYQGANINLNLNIQPVPNTGVRFNCVNQNGNNNCITYDRMRSVQPLPQTYTRDPDFKYWFGMDLYNYIKPRLQGVNASELFSPFINEIAYVPPATPLLLNAAASGDRLCNFENKPSRFCNGTFCECTHMITIPRGALVEFIFADFGVTFDLNHPMHLHGNSFYVIGYQKLGERTNIQALRNLDAQGRLMRNFNNNPIRKDTASVPDGGYTIVRFINDNPGYWFVHCHVDFHTEEGMGFVIQTPGAYSVPDNFPYCGDYLG